MIDEEVSRIIAEQYERAKAILSEHASGHAALSEVLLTREVIFTEDVEKIFGKRQWVSRTDEILAARPAEESDDSTATAKPDDNGNGNDSENDVEDVDHVDVTPPPYIPPQNPS